MTEKKTTAREGALKQLFEKIPEAQRDKVLAVLQAERGQMPDRVVFKDVPEAEITARFDSWNLLKGKIAEALGKGIYDLPESVYALFCVLTVAGRTKIDALLEETDSES